MKMNIVYTGVMFFLSAIMLTYSQPIVSYFYDAATLPVELSVDIKHLDAEIKIEAAQNRIIARTSFKLMPKRNKTDSIIFYAPSFKFSKVLIEGVQCRYIIDQNNIVVKPESNLSPEKEYLLVFEYVAEPENGNPYFVGWNDPKQIMRKQIWAHRPHGWLPFYDDRFTVDMKVTFDKYYSVFSNGVRVSVNDNADSTRTWHYRMNHDHPFFSTALVIGKYLYKTSSSQSGVPLELWYYPEQEDRFGTTYQFSSQMIDFFEHEMGMKYPYELYRQAPVADYLFGAMETTTSTVFGDYMFINRRAYWQRNYINVNAHELAHQWFGNCLSHLTPKDVWLTESFATFYAKLFEKSVFGEDYYQNDKLSEIEKTFAESKKNSNPIASSGAGTNRIYQKGSLVLDMLRLVAGDDVFNKAIKYYLETNKHGYVETQDFLRAFYNTSGLNFDWFFEQWLYRGGEPHYKVSYTIADDDIGQRNTIVEVKQIHQTNELVKLFRMPVDIVVFYKDGTRDSIRPMIKDELTFIQIPNTRRQNIDFVIFDTGNKILKKMTFVRNLNELSAQAQKAPNMIDRWEALVAMRDYPFKDKIDDLIKCYNKETFHLTKSEIILQIARDYDDEKNIISSALNLKDNSAVMLLKKAIEDPDALVRKSVIDNIKHIHIQLKKPFMELLKDTSYLNVELAMTKLYEEYPNDLSSYLSYTKNETGWRGNNIRVKWLELSVLDGKTENIGVLVELSSGSYDFETRINAINSLKRLGHFDSNYAVLLFDAANYWNYKLADVARDALKFYYVITNHKMIIDALLSGENIKEDKKRVIRKAIQ